jgi:RNA polymerase sigma-70 factor (ECF subfamily)
MPQDARPGKGEFHLDGGERQTLDGLFRRHGDAVYRLAVRALGDREEASDVTGEVFLRAAHKLCELRDLEALWPWLRTVTVNLCRDRLRGRRSAPESRGKTIDELADLTGDGGGWPEEMDLTAMAIRDGVLRLAPREREMIVAHYQHGMTYREIAGHQGCSVATVQWWLDRGLKHLAGLVAGELEQAEQEERRGA